MMLDWKQGLWNFSSKIMIKGSLVSLSEANGWWQTCYFPSMHRAAGIKYIKYYVRPIWMQSSHQSGERGNKDWTADGYLVHTRYFKSPLIKNNLMYRNGDVVGIGIQLGRNWLWISVPVIPAPEPLFDSLWCCMPHLTLHCHEEEMVLSTVHYWWP